MRLLALVPMLAFSSAALAPQLSEAPPVRHVNPPGLAKPAGYTHVVIAAPGRTIYIAGQVALDQQGNVVGKGDLRAQATQVFENLRVALEAGGASFDDVVKINTYVVDVSQLPALREVRSKVWTGTPPASTLVQVVALARPDFLIEIEAIAVVPERVRMRPASPRE